MNKETRPSEFLSRPAMESIFLQMARDAVEEAEDKETDWRETGSLGAELRMQDRAMTGIVLLVLALEAFINVEGHNRLNQSLWEAVDHPGLERKWLWITQMTTGEIWDASNQPFLDFNQMIKIRNELVHYKPRFEENTEPKAGTKFQKRFTGALARRFFNCTCAMFGGFYSRAGEETPARVQPGALTRSVILIPSDL